MKEKSNPFAWNETIQKMYSDTSSIRPIKMGSEKLSDRDLKLIEQYRNSVDVTHDAEDSQELCVRLYDMLCDVIGTSMLRSE
jgi:hypothetical protein